jgi:hypothetical protein
MNVKKALFCGAVIGPSVMMIVAVLFYVIPTLVSQSPAPPPAVWQAMALVYLFWGVPLGMVAALAVVGWKQGKIIESAWMCIAVGGFASSFLLGKTAFDLWTRAQLISTYQLLPAENITPWFIRVGLTSLLTNFPFQFSTLLFCFGLWLLREKRLFNQH